MPNALLQAETRQSLAARVAEARARTDEIFAIVKPEALYERPIPERHRLVFYLGHVEAFDWNLIARQAFGIEPFHEAFDRTSRLPIGLSRAPYGTTPSACGGSWTSASIGLDPPAPKGIRRRSSTWRSSIA